MTATARAVTGMALLAFTAGPVLAQVRTAPPSGAPAPAGPVGRTPAPPPDPRMGLPPAPPTDPRGGPRSMAPISADPHAGLPCGMLINPVTGTILDPTLTTASPTVC